MPPTQTDPIHDPADALAHLAKMSGTGSSFGETDYVAINPLAIASFVLGMLSAVAILFNVFAIVAVVGLIVGLLALRKINQSNGTQSGKVLAIAGILLSLLIGGGVFAHELMGNLATNQRKQQCAAMLDQLAREIAAGHYDSAYDQFTTESFHKLVPRETFRTTFHELQRTQPGPGMYPPFGPLEWIHIKDQPIEFAPIAETGVYVATTSARVKYTKVPEPLREYIIMNNQEGSWKIDHMPRMFPEKKVKRKGPPVQGEDPAQ